MAFWGVKAKTKIKTMLVVLRVQKGASAKIPQTVAKYLCILCQSQGCPSQQGRAKQPKPHQLLDLEVNADLLQLRNMCLLTVDRNMLKWRKVYEALILTLWRYSPKIIC